LIIAASPGPVRQKTRETRAGNLIGTKAE
jgi:hypothetical protein